MADDRRQVYVTITIPHVPVTIDGLGPHDLRAAVDHALASLVEDRWYVQLKVKETDWHDAPVIYEAEREIEIIGYDREVVTYDAT